MGVRADTRSRMVTSAALLLREYGVAGTSIAKVLEHSKGPRGSVGFHFPGGKNELVSDALRWAGALVTKRLEGAREKGSSAADAFTATAQFYVAELERTDFQAGCPIGAVAQESYADPVLRSVVRDVFEDWITALAALLEAEGRSRQEARELAATCLAALEGAIMLARVQQTTEPVQQVRRRLSELIRTETAAAHR